MKAAQISQYGDPSIVSINEVEKPVIGPGQVLVEVYAASLNPFDTMVRSGKVQDAIPLDLPVTLGGDIAGVIAEVGEGVTNVAVGDKVYGQAAVVAGNSGAFAEFAATKSSQIAQAPEELEFTEIAALPLVGVSAVQALFEHLNLQSGQKIFIHGGAGGIGSIAVQIAKNIGAYVAATATGEQLGIVTELGADEVIDYKTQDFSQVLKDFDAVFDTVGGDDFNKSLIILKPGGKAVSMIGRADEASTTELGVTALTQSTHVTTEALDKLRELVNSGVVTVRVGQIFSLDQVQEAFTARESGSVNGKVVIAIK